MNEPHESTSITTSTTGPVYHHVVGLLNDKSEIPPAISRELGSAGWMSQPWRFSGSANDGYDPGDLRRGAARR